MSTGTRWMQGAGLAAALMCTGRDAVAQRATFASARVDVPAAIAIRQAAAATIIQRSPHLVVLAADLVASANAGYEVRMQPTAGIAALIQKGVQVSVLTASGAYVPVSGSAAITVGRQERGAGRLTHVGYRLESANVITDADVAVGVEYDAVAGSTAAAAVVSAVASPATPVQVALLGQ